MVKRKIEMITNDEELIYKTISNKKVFLIVSLFLFAIILFLSTSLELKEDRAETLWTYCLIFILILILLFYFKVL